MHSLRPSQLCSDEKLWGGLMNSMTVKYFSSSSTTNTFCMFYFSKFCLWFLVNRPYWSFKASIFLGYFTVLYVNPYLQVLWCDILLEHRTTRNVSKELDSVHHRLYEGKVVYMAARSVWLTSVRRISRKPRKYTAFFRCTCQKLSKIQIRSTLPVMCLF